MSIVKNMILLILVCDFSFILPQSQLRNNLHSKKNSVEQFDGSGNDQENATRYMNAQLSALDDEDSVSNSNSKNLQSSGDGPPDPPDIYPSLSPYTNTRSTATILVDVAIEEDYKSYMLPGAVAKPKLKAFHNEIIKNLKEELISISADLGFTIISLRPGPIIPKKRSFNGRDPGKPSVFARINITQFNSTIVNPMIIFHISHCGRLGVLGNLTISDQIIFPQYVCQDNQVYCLPDCRNGAYCDGISDCPSPHLDESPSCPKCLYKDLKVSANNRFLNEGEHLMISCEFKETCNHLQKKIRWTFPGQFEKYESSFKGHKFIKTFPKYGVPSGSYKCNVDGDSAEINITVFKKPKVMITNYNPDAERIIMVELEGTDINLWCNTTSGHAQWIGVDSSFGKIEQLNRTNTKVTLQRISNSFNIQCQVRWGFEERGLIVKSVRVDVVCDSVKQFQCKSRSGRMCIPIEERCDSNTQCDDGSDEADCNFCTDKSLNVDVGQTLWKDSGDTLIITCSASRESCYPLSWWRHGKLLVNGNNLVVFKQSIFILNASSENAGIYRCSGASDKGHIDLTLHINERPQLIITPPLSEINVTYGQSVDIECSVDPQKSTSDHTLRPMWNYNNNNAIQEKIQIKIQSNKKSILTIHQATKAVEGDYQCEVMWGLGNNRKSSASVRINVMPQVCGDGEKKCADMMMCISESMWCDGQKQCHDGSDEEMCSRCKNGFVLVQPSNLIILAKESAEVTCYYHKDCSQVEWRVAQNKVPLDSINGVSVMDNKLLFNNVGLHVSNVYECFAGEKTSQVNVTVINEVEISFIGNPGYVFVDFGGDIEVDCKSNYGQPQWRKRDFKPIEAISGAKQTFISPNVARLSIKSSSYDARGYYNCSVRLPNSNKDIAKKMMFIHVYDLVCPEKYMKCDQNTTCVPKNKICDEVLDCHDGEDEKHCSKCKYELEIKPKSLVLSTAGWGSIQCLVPHKDCLPIEWQTKSGEKLSHKSFFQFNDSLFIFNSEPREREEIICTNGRKFASSFLTVKNLDLFIVPHQSDSSVLIIKKGDSKIVECRSNLGTPEWIFPKEDTVSSSGVRYFNSQSNVAILQVENAKESASNTYVCSVTFSRELKKKSLSIKIV